MKEQARAEPLTVVLLPGLDGTGRFFAPLVNALSPSYQTQVMAYPQAEPMDYGGLEEWVREALPRNKPFLVVAESFSGPIAVALAASPPAGLQGVILCATFVRNPVPVLGVFRRLLPFLPVKAAPARLLGWLLLGQHASASWRSAISSALASVSAQVIRSRLDAVLSVDAVRLLARAQVPVLYLRATRDRVVGKAAGSLVFETLQSARVADIDGPHFLLQTCPEAAAKEIREFAASIREA
jgi:pimeloyl-ACP methyl ester carboxylesterase